MYFIGLEVKQVSEAESVSLFTPEAHLIWEVADLRFRKKSKLLIFFV